MRTIKYHLLTLIVFLLLANPANQAATMPVEVTPGDKVPNLKLTNVEGEKVALKDLRNKMVLVYFWASWCKPCRSHTPQYPKLYNKYKNASFKNGEDGFEVFMVSLDKDRDKWKKAIEQDGLKPLINVSDLKGWDSKAVKKFKFGAIPRSYLVNGNGVVEAQDLRMKDLDFTLNRLSN